MYSDRIFAHIRLLLMVVAIAIPSLSSAQTEEQPITLEDLIRNLVGANPEISAAQIRYETAQTRPSQEAALPDPQISFGWMSAGTILPGGGLGEDPNASIEFQVSQEIPFPGKRGLRADVAGKEAENQHQLWSVELRSRVAALKTAYYELLYSHDALDLLLENQQTLRELSKVAEARYTVGKAMQQDLIKAQTEVAILQNRILALQQRQQSLAAAINTLLNRPAAAGLGLPQPVALPELLPYESYLSAAKKNAPALLSQQSLIHSREAGLKLAKKEIYPDFELMSGYYYKGKLEDMWEVRAGISLPVFAGSKQRRHEQEAALQLNEAHQNYRSTEQTLEFRLRDAYVKAQTSLNLTELYAKQIVPQSKLGLESSLASYESGGVDFLTVLSNFTSILEYRMNVYEQQTEYLKAHAVLEELAGDAEEGHS